MLAQMDRLEQSQQVKDVVAAAEEILREEIPPVRAVLLRSGQRRWFGSSERAFNPHSTEAELLRSRWN